MQWAAVTNTLSVISEPPHMNLSVAPLFNQIWASQGNWPTVASFPPTIRLCVDFEWPQNEGCWIVFLWSCGLSSLSSVVIKLTKLEKLGKNNPDLSDSDLEQSNTFPLWHSCSCSWGLLKTGIFGKWILFWTVNPKVEDKMLKMMKNFMALDQNSSVSVDLLIYWDTFVASCWALPVSQLQLLSRQQRHFSTAKTQIRISKYFRNFNKSFNSVCKKLVSSICILYCCKLRLQFVNIRFSQIQF